MLLTDRVAFVTGAGSGIGRAGAIAMAAQGALLIVTDLDGERAQSVALEISIAGGSYAAGCVRRRGLVGGNPNRGPKPWQA